MIGLLKFGLRKGFEDGFYSKVSVNLHSVCGVTDATVAKLVETLALRNAR